VADLPARWRTGKSAIGALRQLIWLLVPGALGLSGGRSAEGDASGTSTLVTTGATAVDGWPDMNYHEKFNFVESSLAAGIETGPEW
jgi:hypothetical protein